MSSIFSKIVSGEIPCYKIAETANCLAFLDVNPLAKGHVLVIPKDEIDYYFNLSDTLLAELNSFSKKISKAIEKAIPCKRIGVAIIGLEVPHAHIHLLPLNSVQDINFAREKIVLSNEELSEIAKKIKSFI